MSVQVRPRYYALVTPYNCAGRQGDTITSDGVVVDSTAPTMGTVSVPSCGGVLSYGQSLTIEWEGFLDPESGALVFPASIWTTFQSPPHPRDHGHV
jgi:hypothetical protein